MPKYLLFAAVIAAAVMAAHAPARAQAQSAEAQRPNIVILLTDDQRWDAVGVVQRASRGRFPFFRNSTPNIDRIAAGGVWFNNAFVVDSLCSPSRAAFLTGQYNHINGVIDNTTPLPVNSETYATLLHAAGYRTGFFGKWHMGSQRARPGFDEYASFVGQGQYKDAPLLVNGKDTPTKGWVDDVTTGYAVDFIRRQAHGAQPFLMVLGFKTVHGPLSENTSPPRTDGLFTGQQIDTPANATSYPPYFVNPRPSTFGGEEFRNYFRAVAAMDQDVGKVLDALDAEGIADNTFVVFASDNGWHMREHGSVSPVQRDGEKRSAYEASIRIPLFVRYPPLTGGNRRIAATVLNIDLAPTLLQLAGLPPRPKMQGKSWIPLLTGAVQTLRPSLFYEYFQEQGFIVPRILALRSNKLKLIVYPDHPEYGQELYDLASDPDERHNLIGDPAARTELRGLEDALAAAARQFHYRVPTRAAPAIPPIE